MRIYTYLKRETLVKKFFPTNTILLPGELAISKTIINEIITICYGLLISNVNGEIKILWFVK